MKQGNFLDLHFFTCRLSDSTVSEDAGIEPGMLVTVSPVYKLY
jgi:hypothetical protein